MGGILSASNLKIVGLTLAVIWAVNKFVPASKNPLIP